MKISIFLLLWVFMTAHCFSQQLRINRKAQVDTLYLDLKLSGNALSRYAYTLRQKTENVADRFNAEDRKFVVSTRPGSSNRTLLIRIDSIHVTEPGQQVTTAILSLIGIIGMPVLFAAAGSEFFLAFCAYPVNRVNNDISFSEDLQAKNYRGPVVAKFSSNGGWFRGAPKNEERTFRIYERRLYALLKKIELKVKAMPANIPET